MPIRYRIEHAARLVIAAGHGTFTHDDVMGDQHDVWSRPDVAGYDELVDMTNVTQIALTSTSRVRELAALAAGMDDPARRSKFAIVAPATIAYGLGRMFETHRELDKRSTKEVAVFRTLPEALAFLGVSAAVEMPALE